MHIDLYKRVPLIARILAAILLGIMLGRIMPLPLLRAFATFNALFDQLLRFLVPLIIIGLVTPAIAEMGRGATRTLLATAALAYAFTVGAGYFAYGCSAAIFPHILSADSLHLLTQKHSATLPYFTISIPPLADVMTSLLLSFMLGLGIARFDAKTLRNAANEFRDIVTKTITAVMIPLLPLYIFGLFLDIAATGAVMPILSAFIRVIALIFVFTIAYLLLQFIIAGIVARRNPFPMLATMLPAYVTALGTSSSAATIPVTLQQTLQNGVRRETAEFVIPLCATIHMSGSALKITACAIALMMLQQMPISFPLITGFILLLAITMVAGPGVPGGAIMAALGVLEQVLGFDAQTQAMMITLYIAMDSFGTACNVTGDGAVAVIIDRFRK